MQNNVINTTQRRPNIPNLDVVKKGIDQLLLTENWDKYKIKSSPKKFEKRFTELFINNIKLLINPIQKIQSNLLPEFFYRLRKKSSYFNEQLISEYSYPPNNHVKNIQRANIPYHPVFYCSDNPLTAVLETVRGEDRIKNSAVYYLSEWKLRQDNEIRICPFLFDNLSNINPYKILGENNKVRLKEKMKGYTENEIQSVFEVFKFLSDLFLFDHTYIISSFLAHSNLYANHNLRPDIFIYPSVQAEKNTVNFAFHPNSVIEKLILSRVFKLQISSFSPDNSSCDVSISWVGENKNGIIVWRQVNTETDDGKELINDLNKLFPLSTLKNPV